MTEEVSEAIEGIAEEVVETKKRRLSDWRGVLVKEGRPVNFVGQTNRTADLVEVLGEELKKPENEGCSAEAWLVSRVKELKTVEKTVTETRLV